VLHDSRLFAGNHLIVPALIQQHAHDRGLRQKVDDFIGDALVTGAFYD
jgi:hypothetical protein